MSHMCAVVVRPATVGDAPALADTVHQGFETYRAWAPRGWDPPPLPLQLSGIRGRLPDADSVCLLAEVDGRPAGHVAIMPARGEPDVAHVWMLFVREPWWGTGLAADLLARAVAEAEGAGYGGMRLHTPAEHARARAFYEREGWIPDLPPYYEPMLGLTLVTYRRRLAPHNGEENRSV
jgi:GNAT superfamily N-acetyltransferase